jgi:hypothetical protein
MELTKEQIQFIDQRLENEGIKYWDVRIEMLDHIVSDVENKLTDENTQHEFKVIVQGALFSLGWQKNFNGGGLDYLNKQGWKNANKGYRKMFYQSFLDFFKSYLNLIVLGGFLLGFYFLSELLARKTFLKVSHGIFLSPIVLYFYVFFKTWRKKYGKSVHRDYALTYLIFSFLMLSWVFNFIRVDTDFAFPITYHKPILFVILPFHLILTFAGYQVYKKAISKVEKIRKELLR